MTLLGVIGLWIVLAALIWAFFAGAKEMDREEEGMTSSTASTQDIAQKIMIQRHLPRLKIADVKICGGYWMVYVRQRYPLSGELKRGWYKVKDLIDEVGCGGGG